MTDTTAIDASLGRPAQEPGHSAPGDMFKFPPPLSEPEIGARRSPAEEARTIVTTTRLTSLATISEDGSPWSSIVGYGVMPSGSLSLVVSTLAEHGRNLARDPRASVAIATPPARGADPLDSGRVTLTGTVRIPEGEDAKLALDSHCEAYPAARAYAKFGDFTLYVLDIERVRWVGGFGRMDSTSGEDYVLAEPDPTEPNGLDAVEHLNADHADALLLIAQEVAGYGDATSVECERIDRYGMDLKIRTLRGVAPARVGWLEPCTDREGLRKASVDLVRHARSKRDA
ncbi:MAG: pyridoxamine 5'-phosphate oxidase family protein [Patulibacter sp.]|nr:pyridoxamine 5'-phosphate oxidase family protein [Patulibacter sp.]